MYRVLLLLPTSVLCFSPNNNAAYIINSPDNVIVNTAITRFKPIFLKQGFWLYNSKDDDNSFDPEVVLQNKEDDDEYEWIPDRDKARMSRESSFKRAEASPTTFTNDDLDDDGFNDDLMSETSQRNRRFVYNDEEEELISVLGGKDLSNPSPKRESGFLGDSTLREIAMDFQVPICYLADVLCGWGVPPPIDPNMILGDMVTGEQAFAVLEAIHTLDVGSLNDRYSDYDLQTLCFEYDIELAAGFELALKEGWNLPFGVKTFLRVEQEEFLLEKLAKDIW
jgi:hypothetical protein